MTHELPSASLEGGTDVRPLTSPRREASQELGRDGRQWSDGRSGTFSLIEQMLRDGVVYRIIASETGLSISTIEREARYFGLSRKALWTIEKSAKLENLWGAGLSVREIGEQIGASRGAVVGRANRLGLPKRKVHRNFSNREKSPKTIVWTLSDLGPDQCRFPLGHWKERASEFCGAPTNGGSWCPEHRTVVFQRPVNVGEKFRLSNLSLNVKAAE